jgi:hypothetical protein
LVIKHKILKSSLSKQEYILYGIVSSSNDYRIAWLLNDKLKIDLKKVDDFKVNINKLNSSANYTRYSFEKESISIKLLSNKDENSLKLIKLNFDYFLKICNDFNNLKNIKRILNEMSEINLINNIDSNPKINKKTIDKINLAFILN